MLVDLHTHTTASDGQYSPSELAGLVQSKNIAIWALTDHDTVNGIEEAIEASSEYAYRFIPGIEISCQDSEEIHILGYYIDHTNQLLLEKCAEYQIARKNRGLRIRDYLKTKGVDIDLEEVMGYAQGSVLARPHFARYLVEHGYVADRSEAFDVYLDTDEFRRETDRKKPRPEEAIGIIHQADGLAVLAHPGIYHMSDSQVLELVGRLRGSGLDGIECIYSRHTKEQMNRYLDIAREYNLKISCGSDFHGESVKPDITLGIHDRKKEDNYIWNMGT